MNTANHCPKGDLRVSRLRRWAAAQRRQAASHFVRGLCYGAGDPGRQRRRDLAPAALLSFRKAACCAAASLPRGDGCLRQVDWEPLQR